MTEHRLSGLFSLFKLSVQLFFENKGTKLSASLSYYTLFSLPPLLIIIISISGIFLGEEAVRGELVQQIEDIVGSTSAQFIQSTLSNIHIKQYSGPAAIISVLVLLYSASAIFTEIQSSINLIWNLQAKPDKNIIRFFTNRLTSFLTILILGGILIAGVILSSFIHLIEKHLIVIMDLTQINLIKLLNNIGLFLIIALLFVIIIRMLPDTKIRFSDATVGAIFTAVLFVVGNYILSWYLSVSDMNNLFGAAASAAILMTWVYYSAMILYLGVAFTGTYANLYGHQITPNSSK